MSSSGQFIGNLCFERTDAFVRQEHRFVRIGKLWYNETDHRCSLLLSGFHFGQFICKPFEGKMIPYLNGDINLPTGQWDDHGTMRKEYQWCGFMDSSQDAAGQIVVYGLLKVMPFITPSDKSSVWFPVWLSDSERKSETREEDTVQPECVDMPAEEEETEDEDGENLPF